MRTAQKERRPLTVRSSGNLQMPPRSTRSAHYVPPTAAADADWRNARDKQRHDQLGSSNDVTADQSIRVDLVLRASEQVAADALHVVLVDQRRQQRQLLNLAEARNCEDQNCNAPAVFVFTSASRSTASNSALCSTLYGTICLTSAILLSEQGSR